MAAGSPAACPRCGTPRAAGATRCASCGLEFPAAPRPAPEAPGSDLADAGASTRSRSVAPADGRSGELARRIARLKLWSEAAQTLGVQLPQLPSWAEEASRHGYGGDAWLEVVRGVERIAQKKAIGALESWERSARNRLSRLEAYSVDGRLERDQIDDVLRSARQGEVGQALQTFQQVDRVVALKEKHLDQAREELEKLVSFLRDMAALGFEPPSDPDDVSDDLERKLRGGHLAPLKQQLRSLRTQAMNRLKAGVPLYVSEYGGFLVKERADGVAVELEAAELAKAARSFAQGHAEEALRRLRVLQQVHGSGFVRPGGRSRSEKKR